MTIPAEFAPQSWEMPPGFRVLEESASVVTREFDGEKLDWLVALRLRLMLRVQIMGVLLNTQNWLRNQTDVIYY